jgi:hypothetical protein
MPARGATLAVRPDGVAVITIENGPMNALHPLGALDGTEMCAGTRTGAGSRGSGVMLRNSRYIFHFMTLIGIDTSTIHSVVKLRWRFMS